MINGVINVYKEKGYTSHDVVAKLRGITGQKKIGHTGTLDPDAEGVLPVCLGRATKLCDMLTDKDKTYETVLLLGVRTDTQDVTGTILEERKVEVSEEQAAECIASFVGAYDQIPPMYSALKINGKKLYELAREGKEVERKPRPVQIHQIQIREMDLPRIRMEVTCSKGTYIRTLCHDIGNRLGCGGCMQELTRTRVERFRVEDSLTLAQLARKKEEGTLMEAVLPVDQMFSQYRSVTVSGKACALARNGTEFSLRMTGETGPFEPGELVRVYDDAGVFISICQYCDERGNFKIRKMFYDGQGEGQR